MTVVMVSLTYRCCGARLTSLIIFVASQGGEKGKQQGLEDRIEAMMSPETSQKPIKSKSLEDQIEAVMSHDVQGKKPLEDRIEAMMSHDVKKKLPLEDRIEAMMCEGSTEKKVGRLFQS